MSPNDLAIPEVSNNVAILLEHLSQNEPLGAGLDGGWTIALSSGFNKTIDADLFKEDRKGWPILEGKNVHQFNHAFAPPDFVVDNTLGLQRVQKKRVYMERCEDFHASYMLVFRDVTSSTNMRTVVASIVPPHTFHTNTLYSIMLYRDQTVTLDAEYYKKIARLAGILNSMTFDFVARSRIGMHMSTIIKNLPIPNSTEFDGRITNSAARLTVGGWRGEQHRQRHRQLQSSVFDTFADSLDIENRPLSPAERIHIAARLDALVAHAYGLSREGYETILKSFKLGEDTSLHDADVADWSDNKTLRNFYGEVRKAALPQFDEIMGARK